MHDAGKIVTGLVIFLALATMPFWYNAARGAEPRLPEVQKPAGQTQCVLPAAEMRREHMKVLADWRDEVVRGNDRVFRPRAGQAYEKSLTGACLGCHTEKDKSCDRCHGFMGVSPYCWDCHVEPPKEGR
jgi:hypothetical protein